MISDNDVSQKGGSTNRMTADGATAGSHTLIGGAMGGSAEAAGLAILLFVVAYLYAEEDPE